ATGSSDQTVRVWRLAGCDTSPPLGARFRVEADGTAVVTGVTPRGFAEQAGLKAGDVVESIYLGKTPGRPRDVLGRYDLDRTEPNQVIAFQVRGQEFPRGTSKRDGPALTLFPATTGQWVLWTPQGHYDASIAGDRRHLGWHVNRGPVTALAA